MDKTRLEQFTSLKLALEQELVRPDSERNADIVSGYEAFLDALSSGEVRAAYPTENGWKCETLVKELILIGFRLGHLEQMQTSFFSFCDKHNLFPQPMDLLSLSTRIVPGGTSIRRGAFLASGVTVMPPAFVNIGGYVDSSSMIDSHVTVGSCAQIGKRCHISAAAQIGGVLEPISMNPTIIEDDAFIGGNCGIYEGTHVHRRAVVASGVVITRSTRLYDAVYSRILPLIDGVVHVPEGAVVVSGTRPLGTEFGREHGLNVYTPIIIKYRDEKTSAGTALETALR